MLQCVRLSVVKITLPVGVYLDITVHASLKHQNAINEVKRNEKKASGRKCPGGVLHSCFHRPDIQLSLLVRLIHILSSHGGRKAELT